MAGAGNDDRNLHRITNQSADSAAEDGGCISGKRGNEDSSSLVEVPCSICLELLVEDGSRSMAKLQCGHQFHLDCIGSAFNMKGVMQCPNCRNVEKGQWMYANGSPRPSPELVMEDWIPEDDFYGSSYPEMQYRVHWCPFGELTQVGSFEELEPATATYHNEFHGHHAAAAVNHSYLAYVGPGPAITPRTSDNSNTTDDHFHQLAVAPHYQHQHHHHHHSPSSSLPGSHVVDNELESARGISHPHPFLFSYRPNPRTVPAMEAHQGSNTQMHEQLRSQHPVFNHQRQHHANGPNLALSLVSMTRRGLPPPPPPPPPPPTMPDQNIGYLIYPPLSTSGGHHEPETNQLHAWERDWFPHFPVPSNQHVISAFWNRHF